LSVGALASMIFHLFTSEPLPGDDRLMIASKPSTSGSYDVAAKSKKQITSGESTSGKKTRLQKKKSVQKRTKYDVEDQLTGIEETVFDKENPHDKSEDEQNDELTTSTSSGLSDGSVLGKPRSRITSGKYSIHRDPSDDENFFVEDRVEMLWNDWLCEPQFYQVCSLS